MPPNTIENNETVLEETQERLEKLVGPQASPRKYEIVYFNFLTFSFWHLSGIYGLYLCFTSAKWATIIFAYIVYVMGVIGVTGGAHRLWSHRSFKAKLPLQIILMLFHSMSFQNTAYTWARDHRVHHKYSDTDADPHNATRGFFFSHLGWVFVRKHPEVIKRSKLIDISDLDNNPVLMFQRKYAVLLKNTFCFILPTIIPIYFWQESFVNSWHVNMLRFLVTLHSIFLVNSAAHLWGCRPYDKNILPVQNMFVSACAVGEGFHNYHHAFPWDYRAAELGNNYLNWTAKFIDFFAWIGWAYDLKTVPDDIINSRAKRTGDGKNSWGWGDKDFKKEQEYCKTVYANSEKVY